MEQYRIVGKQKLKGSLKVPGAKNSVLPLMAASVLCRGEVSLTNVPQLSDVAASVNILRSIGCTVTQSERRLQIRAGDALESCIPPHLMCAMRSSVFYIAPILARTGRVVLSQPGGCNLGARPIDIHLAGLRSMGAVVRHEGEQTEIVAPNGLQGTSFTLRFPSVGATETLLMAAVTARGKTVLYNTATEPEVCDLALFLQKAGADIAGVGTSTLTINGKEFLSGALFSVCPDRIATATVLCALAACGGELVLDGCDFAGIAPIIKPLRACGVTLHGADLHTLMAVCDGTIAAIPHLVTAVHPGFPTDAAPLFAAMLLCANGKSTIRDAVFDHRFACATGFAALGGDVHLVGPSIDIRGVAALRGAALAAEDLRGGAALTIAALSAEGVSTVRGVEYINRGYEDLAETFRLLGADIRKEQVCAQD